MGFLPLAIVVWLAAMAAWFLISKYFKSSDADKIKQRLMGVGKARKKTKESKRRRAVRHPGPAERQQIRPVAGGKVPAGSQDAVVAGAGGLALDTGAAGAPVHHGVRRRIRDSPGCCSRPPSRMRWRLWSAWRLRPLRSDTSGCSARGRLRKFEAIFPETLEFISRSMRAGHAFSVSLEMIHREFAGARVRRIPPHLRRSQPGACPSKWRCRVWPSAFPRSTCTSLYPRCCCRSAPAATWPRFWTSWRT